jgi:hypothetical protein
MQRPSSTQTKRIGLALLWWGVLLLLPTRQWGQATYFDFADSVQSWVDARVRNAAAGNAESVEMPLVVRSTGWGCRCPDTYIGASASTQEGPWVWVEARAGFPKVDRKGHPLHVQGRFTGEMHTQDLRNPDGEPEEWEYTMPVFKVTRWRKNPAYEDTPAPRVIGQ